MKNVVFTSAISLVFVLVLAGVAWGENEVAFSLGSAEVLGESRSVFEVGAGLFNANDEGSSAALKLEGRLGRKLSFVGPSLGFVANKDGGFFGYVGFYADIVLERFIFTPLWGFGLYSRGDGKDLGGAFAFRSSLAVSYHLSDRARVGVSVAHVSNADLYDRNPGENDLFLSIAREF